jgi:hypothetical protein
MTVGDYAVETWRDGDRDPSKRWAPPIPVWLVLAWGPVATLANLRSNQHAHVASGDLRPATTDEIAAARAR